MGRLAVDVPARKRKPPSHGKVVRGPGRTAENDLGGNNVAGKPRQGGDLYPHEIAERAAELKIMGRDMERYGFHDLIGIDAAGVENRVVAAATGRNRAKPGRARYFPRTATGVESRPC